MAIMKFIAVQGLPFSIVDSAPFQEMIKAANCSFMDQGHLRSSTTFRTTLLESLYNMVVEQVEENLAQTGINSKRTLGFDTYTTKAGMCVTNFGQTVETRGDTETFTVLSLK